MTRRSISEDAPELAFPATCPERAVDAGLRHHEVDRAVKRLRPSSERSARAVQLQLVELHVLVPQRTRCQGPLPESLACA